MFVNVSNYPSDKWSEEQKKAAGNEIIDVPFPNVCPHASKEEVFELARKHLVQIINITTDPVKVLVQGEFTSFTVNLVRMLQVLGYTPVAACSERQVIETIQPDSLTKKEEVFKFVQFREY